MIIIIIIIIIKIIMIMRKVIIKKMNKKKRYILLSCNLFQVEGQYHYYLPFCFECLNETSHALVNTWQQIFRIKKKLDGKFLRSLMKNFKIWLLPLKETFVDALNTSDIHSNNLNFLSSKRGCFFQNRKIDSFSKEKIFPFGNNCWKGFVVRTDYVFQIKFCIKICKKPPSCFFISYNCFILVFALSADIISLNFLELLH